MALVYDVLVVGGGHAGLEAAWIASEFKVKVAIVTLPEVPIASTPCNPAVGGVGKAQVVKEIDAMGGIMPRIADLSGIQFRTLNESKGFAVQSTRVQVDKNFYAKNAELILSERDIDIIRSQVHSISKNNQLFSVDTNDAHFLAKKLIITAGTFLNGKLHFGSEMKSGGRVDCRSSQGMDQLFAHVKKLKTRFKTGTPARLKASTIDFSRTVIQPSDEKSLSFHFKHDQQRALRQVNCYLTRTNEKTMEIIRQNLSKSPMYNGQITAIGPRYCPSIEDKAARYPDRHSHHVFLEPEELDGKSIYPNGVSTSLPADIQLQFLRTIEGLEEAEIMIPGYAVEYDVVDTTMLSRSLEYRDISGLYFAGQVNGTSGYEEAAGQGLVAGLNAALAVSGQDPLTFSRRDSYIGVMIDDLVTEIRDEPYRLFTARNEYRLLVREDNAYVRMAKYRQRLQLHGELDQFLEKHINEYQILLQNCSFLKFRDNESSKKYFQEMNYGQFVANCQLDELMRRGQLNPIEVLTTEMKRLGLEISKRVLRVVAIDIKYLGYIQRMEQEEAKIHMLEDKAINWQDLIQNSNISTECRQRIEKIRPEDFGQLKRISGIRPATLAYVAGNVL